MKTHPSTLCEINSCTNPGNVDPKRWHGRLCDLHGLAIEWVAPGAFVLLRETLDRLKAEYAEEAA